MATAGGPDSIGELRVDIVGDDSQLDAAIDRAKQKVEAAAGGSGGGSTAGGTATTPASAGGINAGAVNGAAVGVFITQMIAVAEKFEKVGEFIGNSFLDTQKQQLELTQAVRQLNMSLVAQQAMNDKKYAEQAGGVGGRAAGDFPETEINRLEQVNQGLDIENKVPYSGSEVAGNYFKKFAQYTPTGAFARGIYGAVKGGYNAFSSFVGSKTGYDIGSIDSEVETDTRREVNEQQIDENNQTMNRLRRQRGGLINAGRVNTTGRREANAAEALGIEVPAGYRNSGNRMEPVAADMYQAAMMNAELLKMRIQLNSFEGRQAYISGQNRNVQTQGNP